MKKHWLRFALAFCFGITGTAWAADDPLPRSRPEAMGFSPERLARIEQVIKADIERGRLPGMVVAIARKGRLVYYESFGYLDRGANIPMSKDAIFSIASMTKPMTTVGAMMLHEESKILLADPVGKYLPQLLKNRVAVQKPGADGQTIIDTVPARRPMNVQDLMRHTAGISYGGRGSTALHKMYPQSSSTSARTMGAEEFLDKLGSLPLFFQPGTTWDYSLSVDVLGLLVEKVSGQSLGQFLDARLWKPLGMTDTSFVIPPDKVKRYAKALPNDPDTGRPQSVADSTKPAYWECGGGCVASTTADYVRFAQMMLNKGKFGDTRFLGRKTVEHMTSDHLEANMQNNIPVTDASRHGYGFGLGFAVRRGPGIAALTGSGGDYSWGGANGTNFWVDPKEELVVVYMAHTPGPIRQHYRQVMNTLVYQAMVE